MPVFSYVARTSAGRRQQGTQEATSANAVVQTLRERGMLVLEVHAGENKSAAIDWRSLANPLQWLPARSVDVELSLQQMSVLLRSGLTLLTSLKAVADCARRPAMTVVWHQVADKIQQGSSLADAMAPHSCFPHLVVQLVRVGEQTGTLEQVVTRAAETLERRRLLRTHLMTALFYPTMVVVAALGVSIFLVVGVIPKLQVFLLALGRRLPPMTQMLLDISDFVQKYGMQIVGTVIGVICAMIATYLWPPGRQLLDRLILRMFIIGYLLRLAATVQFAHALAVLLRSGVTLVEALRTVESLHRNRFVAGRVRAAREAVLKGGGLAEPLATRGAFMPLLSLMVAVGESAGTLDEVLGEIARFHEMQLQTAIRQFSTIIEPVIVIVVGGIVGFVYIAFFVALFSVAGGPR